MTYEKKQAFEADSEKIEALQQPGQFPELVATDESLVALYNEQLADGQSLTPLQAEDRAMDDETNWTTLRTFFRRAQRQVGERLTVIVSLVSTVLTDVFGHLHERLDGCTEDGIPAIPFGSTASPAVAETLGTLPAAVRLLRSRKITNGATDTAIPDGCSLARLLCDSSLAAEVTEIVDDNTGWTMNRTIPSLFGTLTKIKLGCSVINEIQISTSAELIMDELKTTNRTGTWHAVFNYDGEKLSFPNLETINGYVGSTGVFAQGNYKELYIPKVTRIYDAPGNHGCFLGAYQGRDSRYLRKLVVGKLTSFSWNFGGYYNTGYDSNLTDFIHFEIGQDTAISLNCAKWSPTMALRTDTDADDYVDLREDTTLSNNLAQFLTNFRSFIALRLTDNGAGKTLTLSQSVRDAIHSAEATYGIEDIIITQKGWAISPAPTV